MGHLTLGHSSITTTEKVYAEFIPEQLNEDVRTRMKFRLPELFNRIVWTLQVWGNNNNSYLFRTLRYRRKNYSKTNCTNTTFARTGSNRLLHGNGEAEERICVGEYKSQSWCWPYPEDADIWFLDFMTDNIRVVRLTQDITNNRTGCSFVTVDVLREAIPFYEKNGFRYLDKSSVSSDSDTCLMYYDLTQLVDWNILNWIHWPHFCVESAGMGFVICFCGSLPNNLPLETREPIIRTRKKQGENDKGKKGNQENCWQIIIWNLSIYIQNFSTK